MGLNGRKGRSRTLAAIRRRWVAEAKAAGVDVTDREAVRKFAHDRFLETMNRAIARSKAQKR